MSKLYNSCEYCLRMHIENIKLSRARQVLFFCSYACLKDHCDCIDEED